VLRLLPALNIPDEDIAEALARLNRAAAALAKAA
jgi:acetylornithine/N-succinyldiaminopimelate aminotransferase